MTSVDLCMQDAPQPLRSIGGIQLFLATKLTHHLDFGSAAEEPRVALSTAHCSQPLVYLMQWCKLLL